jgi:DNA-binding transcriptional regulator LsrR (DeoR family)
MVKEKLLLKIAHLYYVENLTQQEIANKVNISRSNISRYLDKAKKEKIFEIKINYPKENFNEIELAIENKYKIKECIIVPTSELIENILKNMAIELSELLDRVLKPSDFIGVNWGNTLKDVISKIKVQKKPGIKVIPMMGGLGKIDTGIQTNIISRMLAEKLGGISYQIHFPAFLDNTEIKKTLEKDSNIKEIFELSEKISIAILGMSSTTGENTLLKINELNQDNINYLKSLGIVGDINLNWVNKNGQFVPNEIYDRTLTITYDRIKKIQNVIGVAFGKNKVEIIKASLIGKLINILITDKETADFLI